MRRTAQLVRDRFRWVDGHADVWRLFDDAEVFQAVVAGLVAPWRDMAITKVCGVESRGFLLGGAAALTLEVGFAAIRKSDGLLPGDTVSQHADADYRRRRHLLRLQRGTLTSRDRVLLVDDWGERGSQALAAKSLIEQCAATFAGVSLIVNQLTSDVEARLGRVTSLVRAHELGDPA